MKILHISPYAFRGGCEKNCFLFIQANLLNQHEVWVQGESGPMTDDWLSLGIDVNHLNILKYPAQEFRTRFKNELHGKKFDLVIYWSTIRLAQVLGALKNHTEKVRVYLGNPANYSKLQVFREIIWNTLLGKPRSIKLMACSQFVAQSFQRLSYFRNFPIQVSYNPIEIPFFNPYNFRFSDKSIRIGMVARLDPIKNHSLIIKAFSLVQKEYPGMVLEFIGDGTLRNSLEELSKSLGLDRKIKFWGDQKDVYSFLQKWDAFVYGTTLKEGLGSVVMEAMANGLPCILPDLPMIRELAPLPVLVNWYDPNSIADLAEKWISLFKKPAQFESMSKSVFEHSQQFKVERFINDYL